MKMKPKNVTTRRHSSKKAQYTTLTLKKIPLRRLRQYNDAGSFGWSCSRWSLTITSRKQRNKMMKYSCLKDRKEAVLK
ncbi:hypothetical protein E2C01_031375 [Portunus trituberculatus]|uniref:Uncharacterized protein n=1 Tax=Portunus trituberculatus TaxID=210409 RepID=A0A5B7ESQ1_PORTR|nr:hypothetical protein [Portunus trituberculatus]